MDHPPFDTVPFTTVLVANRGEIAVRVIRTLRRLGIRSVAVYSDADAGALHVRLADAAVRLGPAPATESYLHIDRVLEAARRTGAQAIHPGFGFLAENADFARACAGAGVVFIGPPPEAIAVMGDKISAKQTVEARGVRTVPGIARPGLTDDDLIAAAPEIGFPVLVKPSAGGGGKGMHVVTDAADLPATVAAARREAAAGFGDDTLFLERYVSSPRHIEVQVVADEHGAVIHLGERECSLQRRHQKVIEEAPSPLLEGLADGAEIRRRLGEAACETARSVAYLGAGTVEFIVSDDAPEDFFFMEMNTRLQVEHPVTEEVTGIDLVELQLRIAAGMPLPLRQEEVVLRGHSIEARVYAEDPGAGFLPTGGHAERVVHPRGDGIRVDSALEDGADIAIDYDPMVAKIIATGPDRGTARARLVRALADTAVLGFETNLEYLRLLLEEPAVIAGNLDTDLIARTFDAIPFAQADERVLAEVALLRDAALRGTTATTPWARADGWRLGGAAPRTFALTIGGRSGVARVRGIDASLSVQVDEGAVWAASVAVSDAGEAFVTVDGVGRPVRYAGEDVHVAGATFRATETVRERQTADAADRSPQLTSPMPGTVVMVAAGDGAHVEAGEAVVVVEAMKMEHVLRSTVAGTVRVEVAVGDRVARGAVVARIEPDALGDDEDEEER